MFMDMLTHSIFEDGIMFFMLWYFSGTTLRWILLYRANKNPWISLIPIYSTVEVFRVLALNPQVALLYIPIYLHYFLRLILNMMVKSEALLSNAWVRGLVTTYLQININYIWVLLAISAIPHIMLQVGLVKSFNRKTWEIMPAVLVTAIYVPVLLWNDHESLFGNSEDPVLMYNKNEYKILKSVCLWLFVLLSWSRLFFIDEETTITKVEQCILDSYSFEEGLLVDDGQYTWMFHSKGVFKEETYTIEYRNCE